MSEGVAIIPARGGSRRIPRKNVKPFLGKTMIAYAIKAAQFSGLFKRIYVSTDDVEIGKVAGIYGARVLPRPEALAQDNVSTQAVMRQAMKALDLSDDTEVCCIYPCTPILTAMELRKARALLVNENATFVVSVRQRDLQDTGWFYYSHARNFASKAPWNTNNTRVFVVDDERAVDINTDEDWQRAIEIKTRRRAA